MINTLIPNNIACKIIYQSTRPLHVFEAEIQEIQYATESRILEFLCGRTCAHLAIKKLGYNNIQPILIGKNREPIWPNKIVGSITHCKGYCAATVSFKKDNFGIGIDAELNTKLPNKIISTIQTNREIIDNKKLSKLVSDVCINKLVFSAKESVFKFIYPFIKNYISFKDVEIFLEFKTQSFSVSFLKPELISKFNNSILIGKFKYNNTHIVTCIYELANK